MRLRTEGELAEELRVSERHVGDLRRRHRWSCVRVSRTEIRYTDAQWEAAIASLVVEPSVEPVTNRLSQTEASRRRAS